MARQSAADANTKAVAVMERPTPPQELTPDQCQEWYRIVNRLNADWFKPEHYSMLGQLCRHTAEANEIAERIQEAKANPNFSIADYDRLLKMQERESRAITALNRTMRLTHQSQFSKDKVNDNRGAGENLWQ